MSFLVNVFIAVLVDVYQNVRVTSGYHPEDYTWNKKQYIYWAIYPIVRKIYRKIRKLPDEDEDDDEN